MCVCVCVCEREREGGTGRGRETETEKGSKASIVTLQSEKKWMNFFSLSAEKRCPLRNLTTLCVRGEKVSLGLK